MKKQLSVLLKYITSITTAFGLLIWSGQTSDFFSTLLRKKYYYEGENYLLSPELKARLEFGVFGDAFTQYVPATVALGAGFFLSLLLWDKKERKNFVNLLFFLFLFVLVPLALINYSNGVFDSFERPIQATTDFIICILGLSILLKTFTVHSNKGEGLVFKIIVIFFISSQAVLVPFIYGILWCFNIRSYILLANSRTLYPYESDLTFSHATWVTYVTTICGIIICLLNLNLDKRNQPGII